MIVRMTLPPTLYAPTRSKRVTHIAKIAAAARNVSTGRPLEPKKGLQLMRWASLRLFESKLTVRDDAEGDASAETVVRLQQAEFEAHLLQRFQNPYCLIIGKIGRARMTSRGGVEHVAGCPGASGNRAGRADCGVCRIRGDGPLGRVARGRACGQRAPGGQRSGLRHHGRGPGRPRGFLRLTPRPKAPSRCSPMG